MNLTPRKKYTPDAARLATMRRIIEVARLLAQEDAGLTLGQIAKLLGVSNRTARRDLYLLMSIGVDIVRLDGNRDDDGAAQWPQEGPQRQGERSLPARLRLDVRSWHGLIFLPVAS